MRLAWVRAMGLEAVRLASLRGEAACCSFAVVPAVSVPTVQLNRCPENSCFSGGFSKKTPPLNPRELTCV